MKEISGGVCAPKGFLASGIRCGIKESSAKKDLALIYSPKTCTASAVFTTNKVKAAPVLLTMQNIASGELRAVIANSGNANACTGETGMDSAERMAQLVADGFSISPNEVAVASTGVIGVPLPIEKIEAGFSELKEKLVNNESGHAAALEAIMTTDTRNKEIAVETEIGGVRLRIGAMAKGSGMMHPNMATMLCFITTDAAIDNTALDWALKKAVRMTFNRVSIDGDTSTNDMTIIMANGEADNETITVVSPAFEPFYAALEKVCTDLARKMARDGEGASKLVTVTVKNACCKKIAEPLAKAVVSSSLVKAACFGADANWGRVLCALGYGAHNAGVEFDPDKVNVSFASRAGEVQVCKDGGSVGFSEEKAKTVLSEEEIEILVDLQTGTKEVTVWGCDLTYDYVKINGDYRS